MLSSVCPFVRRILAYCAVVLVLCATASVPSAALAAPDNVAPPAVPPRPGVDVQLGAEVANFAQEFVGSPYRWGGTSPAGFDCTGFVMWVYSQFGVSLPHNEAGQLASGVQVGSDELQPGDVLVFAKTYRSGLSHVGIYVGDGQFVHAADERHGVTVSALWDSYWGPRLVGATRALS